MGKKTTFMGLDGGLIRDEGTKEIYGTVEIAMQECCKFEGVDSVSSTLIYNLARRNAVRSVTQFRRLYISLQSIRNYMKTTYQGQGRPKTMPDEMPLGEYRALMTKRRQERRKTSREKPGPLRKTNEDASTWLAEHGPGRKTT